jgi:uncharacterized protein (TIGR04255 family)
MFDFLPPAASTPLRAAPLVRVLVQVRFDNQRAFGTSAGASDIHELIGDRYPRLLAEQQAVITAGPTGVSSDFAPVYKMTDLEGRRSVALGTDHVTLELSDYLDWADARARFDEILSAVVEVGNVRVAERVGLRYVNHFESAEVDGRVNPALLASLQFSELRAYLASSASQLILRDDGSVLLVRCGISREESQPMSPFLLDIDCATDKAVAFNQDAVYSRLDAFNDVAFRFFIWSITKDYYERLKKQ